MYYVYVIRSEKDGSTYIGYTEDLVRRIREHNQGKTKSIKHKVPYKLIHTEEFESKTEARKRELRLKKSSFEKEKLFKTIFA
jgi:putative endonuclease